MADLNLRSCCSASARPSVMTCAIFPSSSVAATSNSNAKPVLPDGFCFQIRFSTKEVVTSLDEPTGQNRWSASAESWFSYLHTIFFHESDSFFRHLGLLCFDLVPIPKSQTPHGHYELVQSPPGDLFHHTKHAEFWGLEGPSDVLPRQWTPQNSTRSLEKQPSDHFKSQFVKMLKDEFARRMSHSSSLSQVLVHQAVTPLSKRHIFSETSKTPCEGCGFLIQN